VKLLQSDKLAPFMAKRSFSSTPALMSGKEGDEGDLAGSESDTEEEEVNSEEDFINKYLDPKDRTRVIPPDVSIKYMESVAFKAAYGDQPVWAKFRRNFPVRFRFGAFYFSQPIILGQPSTS